MSALGPVVSSPCIIRGGCSIFKHTLFCLEKAGFINSLPSFSSAYRSSQALWFAHQRQSPELVINDCALWALQPAFSPLTLGDTRAARTRSQDPQPRDSLSRRAWSTDQVPAVSQQGSVLGSWWIQWDPVCREDEQGPECVHLGGTHSSGAVGPPKTRVPRTRGCSLVWRQGLCRCN